MESISSASLVYVLAIFVPSSLSSFHKLLINGVKLKRKPNYAELAKSLCQSETRIELVPSSMHNLIERIVAYAV